MNYFFSNIDENVIISFLELCSKAKIYTLSKDTIENDTISLIEDIIDAIYNGQTFTIGLANTKDNDIIKK